jgi:hypothetical protein
VSEENEWRPCDECLEFAASDPTAVLMVWGGSGSELVLGLRRRLTAYLRPIHDSGHAAPLDSETPQ